MNTIETLTNRRDELETIVLGQFLVSLASVPQSHRKKGDDNFDEFRKRVRSVPTGLKKKQFGTSEGWDLYQAQQALNALERNNLN